MSGWQTFCCIFIDVCNSEKFENQLIFAKVIGKSIQRSRFFNSQYFRLTKTRLCQKCRFEGEFPWLPDIRRVLETEMKCDSESLNKAARQNDSGAAQTTFHRFDASLFHSSPQSSTSARGEREFYVPGKKKQNLITTT